MSTCVVVTREKCFFLQKNKIKIDLSGGRIEPLNYYSDNTVRPFH